jgi:hypothetical protein
MIYIMYLPNPIIHLPQRTRRKYTLSPPSIIQYVEISSAALCAYSVVLCVTPNYSTEKFRRIKRGALRYYL